MSRRMAIVLPLSLGLALSLLWLLGSSNGTALADPGILYVAPGGNCAGATPCYATVQAAVDAANPGDEIRVAAGTYTGVQNVPSLNTTTFTATQMVAITKTVTIRGGYNTADWGTSDPMGRPTTLNAQGQGRVIYINGYIAPTVEGLCITGGDATGLGGTWWGGGVGGGICVHNASAIISGNCVYSNTATAYGGGLYLGSSPAVLSGNRIYSNTVNRRGGGLYLDGSNAMLIGNTIYSNAADIEGGGVCIYWSDATLNDNTIYGNNTVASQGGGLYFYGGGLYLYGGNSTLIGNIISGNTAWWGGGIYLAYSSRTRLHNNVIADNTATKFGSGVFVEAASPTLIHITIARNGGGDGSGVYIVDDGYSVTVSDVTMVNTILVSHTVGITVTAGNTITLNATLWHANTANWGGDGTINHSNDRSGNPAFALDGYHLTGTSAAIDAGVDAGVTTDIDGDARPWGQGYDIGADECKAWRIYLPIILKKW